MTTSEPIPLKVIDDPLDLMVLKKPPTWPAMAMAGLIWTSWILWKILYQETHPQTLVWMGRFAACGGLFMLGYIVYYNLWWDTKRRRFQEVRHAAAMAFLYLRFGIPNSWIKTEEQANKAIEAAMKYVPKNKL